MRWRIVTVGKPRLAYARDGVVEYLSRIRCFANVEEELIKPSNSEKEGVQLLARSEGSYRLILDERGKVTSSREFAELLKSFELNPRKSFALLIGGADGLTPEVRASADFLWALSPMTLQHELALVVALEQIYRAHTIVAGLPYHRD